jgi:uncharacterized protein (TIGR03435 family)
MRIAQQKPAFTIALIAACASCILAAQVEFEVASVKPTNPRGGMVGCLTYPGGRVFCGASTLGMLLEVAFHVQRFQISGGPDWINAARYDIDARPSASSKSANANPSSIKNPPNDEQLQMLQALLEDRFQLKFHRSVKPGPVYLLVMGNKKLKLVDAKDKNEFSWVGSPQGGAISGDGIAGTNISMPLLAERLSGYLKRPVLDNTGLTGSFDFRIDAPPSGEDPDVTTSILDCLHALGLELKAAKAPVETIFIDHAAKPTEN